MRRRCYALVFDQAFRPLLAAIGLMALVVLATLPLAAATSSEPDRSGWAQWRGPLGTGVSPDGDPPIEWSETKNVLFKVDVPGESLASPVVWGDRIYLVSAISLDQEAYETAQKDAQKIFDDGEWPPDVAPVKQRFLVQARSRHDGSLIWERTAREGGSPRKPLSRFVLGLWIADRRR